MKIYDVEVKFYYWDASYDGCVRHSSPSTIELKVSDGKTVEDILRVFFHELGHVYCYRTGLWKNYHQIDITHPSGLRAEKWVDNWASVEMGKHYPEFRYIKLYHTPYGKAHHRSRMAWRRLQRRLNLVPVRKKRILHENTQTQV